MWSAAHRRRLRDVWRSAGWPYQDLIEVELLVAGLLERRLDALGRETVRVSDAGLHVIAEGLRRNRAAREPHEALVKRVAREMQRAGRIVWRGLSLRAPLPDADGATRWPTAMPDVYSIRNTTLEERVHPVVHEIKVRRADLLSDLRRPDKGAAYLAIAAECWYVLEAGIASADEVPSPFGVLVASADGLRVERVAPHRPMGVPFSTWIALCKSQPEPALDEAGQGQLTAAPEDDPVEG